MVTVGVEWRLNTSTGHCIWPQTLRKCHATAMTSLAFKAELSRSPDVMGFFLYPMGLCFYLLFAPSYHARLPGRRPF